MVQSGLPFSGLLRRSFVCASPYEGVEIPQSMSCLEGSAVSTVPGTLEEMEVHLPD